MQGRFALVLAVWTMLLAAFPLAGHAQDGSALIEMQVDAAYDGFFRDDQWLPVRVTVTNNGDDIDGRIIVRPETSRGVNGAFSVPFELPTNSRKTDFLYISARAFTTNLRVELIDNADELVLANRDLSLRQVQPPDQLYVVLTQSAAGSIDMTRARGDGMGAFQANWEIDSVPDHPAALAAINMMVFTDIDSGGLTLAQEAAIEAWVVGGGHLVVTGGPNWQATAAGLLPLLPLTPDDSETVDDLSALAGLFGAEADLSATTVMATGALADDAEVLVETAEGLPLLVRRSLGEGTVDYLAADPNVAPLRGWDAMGRLWYTMAITADPAPNWARGFTRWEPAAAASAILPGLDVLPSVLPLCGFLALYIALIGPLNYLVLNRVGRREFAWVTIPVLIVLFSGLAYVVGGQLRGNEPSVGRLTMVQSWNDTELARSTQLIGLLSPQRTRYTLEAEEDTFLRAVPRTETVGSGGLVSSTFETNIEFQQGAAFRAVDFLTDASRVEGFAAYGTQARPDFGGTVTMFYPEGEQRILTDQVVRGSVRNNTDFTLEDVVILARSASHQLRDPLAPGDVATFEFRLDNDEPPAPAPIGYQTGQTNLGTGFSPYGYSGTNTFDQSAFEILGSQNWAYNPLLPGSGGSINRSDDPVAAQEMRRRQLFLMALMVDPFISTGRGNSVYAVGWADAAPNALSLGERSFRSFDSTMYVTELDVNLEYPAGREVRVGGDQFTWAVTEKNGLGEIAPVRLSLSSGNSIAFRFTPLLGSRLDAVDEVAVVVRRTSGSSRSVPVQVWNWATNEWENHIVLNDRLTLDAPEAVVGPQNAVIVRLFGDDNAFLNLESIHVEQTGSFAS